MTKLAPGQTHQSPPPTSIQKDSFTAPSIQTQAAALPGALPRAALLGHRALPSGSIVATRGGRVVSSGGRRVGPNAAAGGKRHADGSPADLVSRGGRSFFSFYLFFFSLPPLRAPCLFPAGAGGAGGDGATGEHARTSFASCSRESPPYGFRKKTGQTLLLSLCSYANLMNDGVLSMHMDNLVFLPGILLYAKRQRYVCPDLSVLT